MIRVAPETKQKASKREVRKKELIEIAIQTLAEKGYAKTSLRDVAITADVSHGSLLYYFKDKEELLINCISTIKNDLIRQLEEIILSNKDPDVVIDELSNYLAQSVFEDWQRYYLWYDLCSQAKYESCFQSTIQSVEKDILEVIMPLIKLLDFPASPKIFYGFFDGIFRMLVMEQIFKKQSKASIRKVFKSTFTLATNL